MVGVYCDRSSKIHQETRVALAGTDLAAGICDRRHFNHCISGVQFGVYQSLFQVFPRNITKMMNKDEKEDGFRENR